MLFVVLAAFGGFDSQVWAGEGGAQNIPSGAKTVLVALLPPPGATEVYGYLLWLSARSVRNSAGASTTPNFRADLYANATQFAHTWHATFFDTNVSSNLIYVVDYARVKIGSLRDENGDLSQFIVQPGVLTWAWGDWHLLTGPLIFLPVGKYAPQDPANATVHYGHYFTFGYEWGITWMPTPRFELSLHPAWGFNMRDQRTGYRSGDLENLDWGFMGRPLASQPKFGIGLCGYWDHQFTDDRRDGVRVPGQRITQNALGPQLEYDINRATAVVLKYEHEIHADASARGNLLWIEFALPVHF